MQPSSRNLLEVNLWISIVSAAAESSWARNPSPVQLTVAWHGWSQPSESWGARTGLAVLVVAVALEGGQLPLAVRQRRRQPGANSSYLGLATVHTVGLLWQNRT
jgi:hypothetical protein